ncbi:PE-PGRS family protein PE_PGRS11 [Mycobacterium tuberculosis H37Rv] [Mycobacterium shimoidei]|uniref:PE-PGRS family protein PE_PGRS11 [Mycobacterium tuberculosis H37Rv] n=1 Tax=Mycobacterium shimoidei TaxID=29313 RepID=A0A375YTJ9_MYCSH|nr:histidine phosphatase family protein [Mycobacterium shimoidei]SRX92231.1 PE-PGRS family protein PE_PGRS11 [Mycobacterium tuberculosis H37Rv] [Mycobacterium shimoidei]
MQVRYRPYVVAAVALIGAGVIAITPMATPGPDVHPIDIQLTSDEAQDAQDAQDIVIDFVRHGQRMPPANEVVTPSPDHPGPPLSELGEQQAQDVANQLHDELGDHVAGIFSGEAIRDINTAAPFADLENHDIQILSGLNEIDSGIYAGAPLSSLYGYLYELTPMLWTLFGLVGVPIPGSVEDPNGVVLNEKFTDAVETMYNAAMANPVVSDNGEITAVAFNNEADLAAWVTLNVNNPDISFFLPLTIETILADNDGYPLLPNGGVVEIKGNPTDGWTLVSWNGQMIPQDPGLLTELLVDLRHVIIVQQTETWNIWQALMGGDLTTIEDAIQVGTQNLNTAVAQLPEAMFNDIVDAIQNIGNDTGGQAAGDTAMMFSDIFAALF